MGNKAYSYISRLFYLAFMLFIMICCKHKEAVVEELPPQEIGIDLVQIQERGVLRVITMESAFSYYIGNNDDEMGFDYDLALNLADYLDLNLQLILAENATEMLELLESGEGDLVAFRLATRKPLKERYAFVDMLFPSQQVLVQRKGRETLTDVTQLIGQEVYVRPKSSYAKRLENLNNELGGAITIKEVPDSVTIDELIIAVSKGDIDYTIADNDIVALSSGYLSNIDYQLPVGLVTEKGWLVRKDSPVLLENINTWYASIEKSKFMKQLTQRYIQKNSYFDSFDLKIPQGSISPFDDILKSEAPRIGWDWQLLAALAWNESHFNPYAVSRAGAMGVMQMMPRTAQKYGLTEETIVMPQYAIPAGVEYIKRLDMIFRRVENKEERIKFILAGYNSGPGHVLDAMALAEKYGDNAYIWYDNVEKYLLLKNKPEYYNDSVCKSGFFRGNHTVRYVDDVMKTYQKYMGHK